MDKGANLKITKLEKGPLQRFKNQNLLLKKFGEVGLQIYKVITGKRTTEELRSDLDMDSDLFTSIITYMEEAGMIELKQIEGEAPKLEGEQKFEELKKEGELTFEEKEPEELKAEEVGTKEADLIEEIKRAEKTKEKKKLEEKAKEKIEEKIEPISLEKTGELELESEKTEKQEKKKEEEIEIVTEKEAEGEEETNEEKEKTEESLLREGGEIELEKLDESISTEDDIEQEELSPVEKMIREKYGDVGLKVYELIDGQRTTEEIMKETGLTELKLVEILEFMDAQGIIKLEYPKGKKPTITDMEEKDRISQAKDIVTPISDDLGEGFKELLPVLVPLKVPSNFIKDITLRVDIIIKYGEKGGKVFDLIDGKNDIIDIVLKTTYPLYDVEAILKFFLEKKAIFLKPLSRTEVMKKYGDDAYSVYKRYGKEGLMLYELMGKEFTIKQMIERVTKDKDKAAEMLLFIHQVLKIDLPLDKDMIYKQLGP